MSTLQQRTQAGLMAVRSRISKAAQVVGRQSDEITLLAVSKTCPPEAVIAALAAGQMAFGENYVQEGTEKIASVAQQIASERSVVASVISPDTRQTRPVWHFIGPLQSNKTRAVAEAFDWVQSVDRAKIAERLSDQRPAERGALQVLLQVNVSGEASKSGVTEADVPAVARHIASLPRLRLRGLMAIPAPESDPALQRLPLDRMKALFEQLRADGLPLDTLSMGMSADLEAAIAAGATLVRVGTAIFGERS